MTATEKAKSRSTNPPGLRRLDLLPPRRTGWTPRNRARLAETAWARVGTLVLTRGILAVRDELEAAHEPVFIDLGPGEYEIATRSCETRDGRWTTGLRVSRGLDGYLGMPISEFHVGTGLVAFYEPGDSHPMLHLQRTVFGDGYYRVDEVKRDGELVGVELDLINFHLNWDLADTPDRR